MKKSMAIGILAITAAFAFMRTEYIQAAEQTLQLDMESDGQVVLVDDENCWMAITGVQEDALWGYVWNVAMENRSEKELMFSMDNVSVNGYMCDPLWASEVSAGKKANSEVSWSEENFAENGIDTVKEVAFTLRVYDSEDWMADHLLDAGYTVTLPAMEGEEQAAVNKALGLAEEGSTEGIVLVENEGCLVKLMDIEEDGMWGYTWKVYLENHTDTTQMFSTNNVSVNGWVCDPGWAMEVAAGKKANVEWHWYEDRFAEYGIEDVTAVEGTVMAYDSADWMADYTAEETFAVYPMGEDAVETFVRVPEADEIVLADNAQCSVIVTGYEPDAMFGYEMQLYLENKTDRSMMFVLEDASVNGYMCDPYWANEVPAGKRSNTAVTWFATELEDNGIAEVERIEGTFIARDYADYEMEPYVETEFAVEP